MYLKTRINLSAQKCEGTQNSMLKTTGNKYLLLPLMCIYKVQARQQQKLEKNYVSL